MSFAGIAYLIWVLVIGVARHLVNELSYAQYAGKLLGGALPVATRWLQGAFINASPVFDLAGVLWLLLSLGLIVGAGRQRWSQPARIGRRGGIHARANEKSHVPCRRKQSVPA